MILQKNNIFLLSDNDILYNIDHNNKIEKLAIENKFSNENIKTIRSTKDHLFFLKEGIIYQFDSEKKIASSVLRLPYSLDLHDIIALKNRFYFATTNGIISIPQENKNRTEFLILKLNNTIVNGESNRDLNNLKSYENNIEVLFDIISSSPINSYKIKYKIDKNPWESINNAERNLRFSSLSYGKHNVTLRIEHDNQVVNKNIFINISAPFWMTWWAITIAILILIGLIYLYFQNKIRLLNNRNQTALAKSNLEKLVNQSKLKSLKSQMNPHFYFNELNTLQSYILANEKKEAVFYLSKFSRLTRNILDMSDNETQSLSAEIEMLKDYIDLEKIRFGDDFQYEININEFVSYDEMQLPSLITQPFVENAIKHGLMHKNGLKSLKIDFVDVNNYFEIHISDNGIGRKRSAELNTIKNNNHRSFATQAINERINILNQQLKANISVSYTDYENPTGTTVIITVPKQLFQ